MATVIYTRDGQCYGGQTPEDAVEAMRDAGLLTFGKTIEEYMRVVSRRCIQWDGVFVRHDTAANFLNDLGAAGLIQLGELQ